MKKNLSFKVKRKLGRKEVVDQQRNSIKVGLHEFSSPFRETNKPVMDATQSTSKMDTPSQPRESRPIPRKILKNLSKYLFHFDFVLVGGYAPGKTAIFKRLKGDVNVESVLYNTPTIGVDFISKTVEVQEGTIRCRIWDTAGNERFVQTIIPYIRGAVGIMLVYDITRRSSFDDGIPLWLPLIEEYCKSDVKTVLLGKKCDSEGQRGVSKEEGEEFAKKHGMKFFETSAKDNINIEEAFTQLVTDVLEAKRLAVIAELREGRNTVNCNLL